MLLSKSIRIIIKIIISAILLSLPYFGEVYYQKLYYLFAFLFILTLAILEILDWEEKRDERFLKKWPKRRDKGFWINVFLVGLGSFLFMGIMVSLGQLFGNGITPLEIVNTLPKKALTKVLITLIVFASTIGIIDWYEKERKYEKLYRKKSRRSE